MSLESRYGEGQTTPGQGPLFTPLEGDNPIMATEGTPLHCHNFLKCLFATANSFLRDPTDTTEDQRLKR